MKKIIKLMLCGTIGLFPMTNEIFAQTNTNLGTSSGSGGSGVDNSFIGYQSGFSNSSGSNNTFLGSQSGELNTTGYKNVFLGWYAGRNNISGYNNVFLGTKTGKSNTTGYRNTYVGPGAGLLNSSGNSNAVFGYLAGRNNQTGNENVFLGPFAGYSNLGSSNVFIGSRAGFYETGSDKLYIDNSNTTTPLIKGDFLTNQLTINGGAEVTGNFHAENLSSNSLFLNGAGGVNFRLRDEPILSCNETKWHFEVGRDCGPGPLPPAPFPLLTLYHKSAGTGAAARVGIGTTSPQHGKLMIQDSGVPFAFKVQGANEQTGGLWRMFVVNGGIGFDANTASAGNEFSTYKRPIKMDNNGNFGRVAIANNFTAPQCELDVNGDVRAMDYLMYSDERLKKNIEPIKNAGELLSKLEGVTYNYRSDLKEEGRNFSEGQKIGFIAQEVQKVIPEIVHEDELGYLSVSYQSLIPILVENQKELQAQNDELKEELTDATETNLKLEKEIEEIKAMLATLVDDLPSRNIQLDGNADEMLLQNAPNPFTESTTIEYNLPAHCAATQMVILNSRGQVVKSIENLEIGRGKIVLEGNTLAPGTYHYSLVCQGETLASKSMIIVQ